MKPILLAGANAFSPFRIDAIKAALAAADPALVGVEVAAKWVYAIEPATEEGVDSTTLEKAASLLNASGDAKASDGIFYVTPRKGTISPWSSKATDIFRNCGLKGIVRVERGIEFSIASHGAAVSPFASGPRSRPSTTA